MARLFSFCAFLAVLKFWLALNIAEANSNSFGDWMEVQRRMGFGVRGSGAGIQPRSVLRSGDS